MEKIICVIISTFLFYSCMSISERDKNASPGFVSPTSKLIQTSYSVEVRWCGVKKIFLSGADGEVRCCELERGTIGYVNYSGTTVVVVAYGDPEKNNTKAEIWINQKLIASKQGEVGRNTLYFYIPYEIKEKDFYPANKIISELER